MENLTFSRKTKLYKFEKIKRVIFSKIANVSEENIHTILRSINIDKQYFIKTTRNPQKFLNIITEENVCKNNEAFKSHSQIIYGSCKAGKFENIYEERNRVEGWVDKTRPAAALKEIVFNTPENTQTTEHLLVIYEPMNTQENKAEGF